MRLWPCSHRWLSIGSGGSFRTCPACCRTEIHERGGWSKLKGVDASNWPAVVRRISLDGCDSLAEHREMLSRDPLGFNEERLAQGEADAMAGRVRPMVEVMAQVRARNSGSGGASNQPPKQLEAGDDD